MKKLKEIPVFESEQEEREFWENHDSSEYLNLKILDTHKMNVLICQAGSGFQIYGRPIF